MGVGAFDTETAVSSQGHVIRRVVFRFDVADRQMRADVVEVLRRFCGRDLQSAAEDGLAELDPEAANGAVLPRVVLDLGTLPLSGLEAALGASLRAALRGLIAGPGDGAAPGEAHKADAPENTPVSPLRRFLFHGAIVRSAGERADFPTLLHRAVAADAAATRTLLRGARADPEARLRLALAASPEVLRTLQAAMDREMDGLDAASLLSGLERLDARHPLTRDDPAQRRRALRLVLLDALLHGAPNGLLDRLEPKIARALGVSPSLLSSALLRRIASDAGAQDLTEAERASLDLLLKDHVGSGGPPPAVVARRVPGDASSDRPVAAERPDAPSETAVGPAPPDAQAPDADRYLLSCDEFLALLDGDPLPARALAADFGASLRHLGANERTALYRGLVARAHRAVALDRFCRLFPATDRRAAILGLLPGGPEAALRLPLLLAVSEPDLARRLERRILQLLLDEEGAAVPAEAASPEIRATDHVRRAIALTGAAPAIRRELSVMAERLGQDDPEVRALLRRVLAPEDDATGGQRETSGPYAEATREVPGERAADATETRNAATDGAVPLDRLMVYLTYGTRPPGPVTQAEADLRGTLTAMLTAGDAALDARFRRVLPDPLAAARLAHLLEAGPLRRLACALPGVRADTLGAFDLLAPVLARFQPELPAATVSHALSQAALGVGASAKEGWAVEVLQSALRILEPEMGARADAILARLAETAAPGLSARIRRAISELAERSALAPLEVTRDRADDGAEQEAERPGASPDHETGLAISYPVENAGLVLLWPFLQMFFDRLDLLDGDSFFDRAACDRAVGLCGFLAAGDTSTPETGLALAKLICGLPPRAAVPPLAPLDPDTRDLAEGLLIAVTQHWPPLSGTDVAGLRQTFLMRAGVVETGADGDRLTVAPGPFDMLLGQVPWTISAFRLPWMPRPLEVAWR